MIISSIKKIPFFSNLNDNEIEELYSLCERLKYLKNTIIFSQSEKGDTLYIILKGEVKVVLFSEEGREVILSILREGDFFGEMAILDGLPRSASVISTLDTELLVLRRDRFIQYISKKPEIALSILAEMSKRLREADERIESLSLLDVYGRTAKWIMNIAKKSGKKIEGGVQIDKIPKQSDIAGIIGTTRESVSRVLSYFQRAGMIIIKGKSMIILDKALKDVFTRKGK